MRRITDTDELSRMVMRHFKRGVITNNFLTPADYRAEIAEGRMFGEDDGENLLLFLEREECYKMFFYLLNAEKAFPHQDKKIVTELPPSLYDLAERGGFTRIAERVLLKTESRQTAASGIAEHTDAEDTEKVYDILKSSFDPLTGNLPTVTQIKTECGAGEILVIKQDGECAAILRGESAKNTAKIKHLAVDEKYRGRGFADELLKDFLAENQGKKCSVWTGVENEKALNLYKKFGFSEEKDRTAIYVKG